MDLYPWVVVAHIIAVIVTFGAHGVSAFAMFVVKRESDRARLSAILSLSSTALVAAGIALLVAVVLGIVAAIMGGHFGRLWPWASIVVVVIVWLAMTPMAATPMSAVRIALGLPVRGKIAGPPGADADIVAAQARIRPEIVAAIGLGAIAILVWLMEVKPF